MSLAVVNEEQQAQDAPELDEDQIETVDAPSGDVDHADAGDSDDGAEGVVVTFGDESPPSEEVEAEAAPQWIKDLRKEHREQAKEIRALRAEREAAKAPKPLDLGPKPTFEGCDFNEEEFERQLDAWRSVKAQHEAKAAKEREEQQEIQKSFDQRFASYQEGKAKLQVKDFEEAESTVKEAMNPMQQSVLVAGPDMPAEMIYALSKNPVELKKLASIKEPVQFAFAVARLESKLKVTPRKAAPLPEAVVRGTSGVAGSDKTLARLEAEADKSGDRSKVIAYRRQQKQRAA